MERWRKLNGGGCKGGGNKVGKAGIRWRKGEGGRRKVGEGGGNTGRTRDEEGERRRKGDRGWISIVQECGIGV